MSPAKLKPNIGLKLQLAASIEQSINEVIESKLQIELSKLQVFNYGRVLGRCHRQAQAGAVGLTSDFKYDHVFIKILRFHCKFV